MTAPNLNPRKILGPTYRAIANGTATSIKRRISVILAKVLKMIKYLIVIVIIART